MTTEQLINSEVAVENEESYEVLLNSYTLVMKRQKAGGRRQKDFKE